MELGLSPGQYSNAASIFQVGYLVFQLPATLLVRKIGPPYQVIIETFSHIDTS
jgi:hypothetical protein